MLRDRPDLDIKKLRKLQRQYWNAFKHAAHHSGKERDDDELLRQFTDLKNDTALYIGWYDYAGATKRMPVEAQVHQSWYIALNLEKLAPKYPPEPYERVWPALLIKPRSEQKRQLRELIAWARTHPEVTNDPKTDNRPLMLAWP